MNNKPTNFRMNVSESFFTIGPFDKSLHEIQRSGYGVISLEKNAQQRILGGTHSPISNYENWVSDAIIYLPKEKNQITKCPKTTNCLEIALKATEKHRRGEEFFLGGEELERILCNSIYFSERNIEIPTDRFNSDYLTVWLFGGELKAKNYGEFLKDFGIDSLPIRILDKEYVNNQKGPFLRQLFLRGIQNKSMIDGAREKLSYTRISYGFKEYELNLSNLFWSLVFQYKWGDSDWENFLHK